MSPRPLPRLPAVDKATLDLLPLPLPALTQQLALSLAASISAGAGGLQGSRCAPRGAHESLHDIMG